MADLPLDILGDGASNPARGAVDAGADRVVVTVGDITSATVVDRLRKGLGDGARVAIVNAANAALAGGGGVDGAIHRAAGSDRLQAYTRGHYPGGCPTGLAVISPAFDLEARGVHHILHTVGPVWSGEEASVGPGEAHPGVAKIGGRHEDVLLASCYVTCLKLCVEHGIDAVAFPGISTGVYGFPKERAARVALGHVLGHLRGQATPRRVCFCCFSDADAATYRDLLTRRGDWLTARKRV